MRRCVYHQIWPLYHQIMNQKKKNVYKMKIVKAWERAQRNNNKRRKERIRNNWSQQ